LSVDIHKRSVLTRSAEAAAYWASTAYWLR
jgi:hypothetical protein